MTIRVLLIDDHPVVRAGLRALLEGESDLELVGEAGTGTSGISLAHRVTPDIVVTDLLLPDVDGVEVIRSIRVELPATQVIVLTSAGEDDAAVVRAVRAGAIGYVLKSAETRELVHTIRSAANGQVHLSAGATARLMQEVREPKHEVPLSDRERDVLREIASGRSNKEIARSLFIAETTVKSHVRAILDKLGVQSRTQAALHAVQTQLVASNAQPAA
jgi:DNA-binding NarL/FixJ family response regulator